MNERLAAELTSYDEFLYFPSISWHHSWERQQTIIDGFCKCHSKSTGVVLAPTGLIDHAPWRLDFWKNIMQGQSPLKYASSLPVHASNPTPQNLNYVQSRFPRGTNEIFACLAIMTTPELRSLKQKKGKRLVLASYVNPLVERFLASADLSILDLAERRQANDSLSTAMLNLERKWAGRVDVLVADNEATLDDYSKERTSQGKPPGYFIPQGFTPLATPNTTKQPNNVAAYLGNLHGAIDYEYFHAMIEGNPDWIFKLCGTKMNEQADKILTLKNVKYVGPISSDQIGEFLSDASMGLIPYKVTEWTAGVFPTKLFEYLGFGLPVLSTPIPEVAKFANDNFIVVNAKPVKLQPRDVSPMDLEAFLAPHTWQRRFDSYAQAISECKR